MNSRQSKKCPHCQSEISPDDAFCPECGSPVSASIQNSEVPQQASDIKFCIHCGDALTADDAFCPGCGQPTTIPSEVSESVETIGPVAAPAQPPAAPASPVAPPVKIKVLHCPDCNMPLIPGSVSCTKCGKKFSKPIPKVVDDTKPRPQGKLQDPVLKGEHYHCPNCKNVLKTGAVQCTDCGVSFAQPVPSYKIPLQEAERMRREDENQRREEAARVRAVEVQERAEALARAKVSLGETAAQVKVVAHGSIRDAAGSPQVRQKSLLIFLFVVIAVGGGIAAIINSSRSHTNLLPADTSQSQLSASVADLTAQGQNYYDQGKYSDAISSYQAALNTNPPSDIQDDLTRRIRINQQMLAQGQQNSPGITNGSSEKTSADNDDGVLNSADVAILDLSDKCDRIMYAHTAGSLAVDKWHTAATILRQFSDKIEQLSSQASTTKLQNDDLKFVQESRDYADKLDKQADNPWSDPWNPNTWGKDTAQGLTQ